MTYPAPDIVPYDEWFDSNYKYDPDEKMSIATDNPRPEEEIADDFSIHEKMYKIATDKYNPFSVGGSENIHDFD